MAMLHDSEYCKVLECVEATYGIVPTFTFFYQTVQLLSSEFVFKIILNNFATLLREKKCFL